MPVLKTCYYEVLGIERNASDDDIKKSFRKLALQLHPDKNLDRHEEAKVEFQVLQQAYEVLSNPQERAWYDTHRHAILRGGLNEDFADDSIDIMAFCSSSCYKGFGDDDDGFYTVYRKLFEKLAAEEVEAGLEDSDEEIPSFGDYLASYEEDVGPFYAFWESFCTRKNFAWHDEFDTRRAGCRRISRLMDKENKKLRTEAKKDWNQRVRALVDFVKRKDKRVQAWKGEQDLRLKEKEAILAKRFAEEKAKRQEERKKILEAAAKNGHSAAGIDSKEKLQEMEAWMADEFGDTNDVGSDEEEDCLYCEVCNKSFRTDKAFMNHEKSKKHLRQVQILREQMEEDDENYGEENEVAVVENGAEDTDDLSDEDNISSSNGPHTDNVPGPNVPETQSAEPLEGSENEEEAVLKNFINIRIKKTYSSDVDDGVPKAASSLEVATADKCDTLPSDQTKKKRRRAPKETKQSPAQLDAGPSHRDDDFCAVASPPTCTFCKKNFENKNLLFKHLKQFPEHAAPKILNGRPATDPFAPPTKGKKGKNRR